MNAHELEERLIAFSTLIIELTDKLPFSKVGQNLTNQLVRSGTSVTLNYGEAQGSESMKDFIHKLRIVLKELRETFAGLKLIDKIGLISDTKMLAKVMDENNELIAIFVSSIKTASSKLK